MVGVRIWRMLGGRTIKPEIDVTSRVLQNIQQTAQIAALQTVRQHGVKMPWEAGPLAPLFGQQEAFMVNAQLELPKVGLVDTLIPVQKRQQEMVSQQCKRFRKQEFQVSNDNSRDRALNWIKVILLLDLQATELGLAMTNLAGGLDESADIVQALRDAFATKATGTLLTRTNSFWNCAKWCAGDFESSCLHSTERMVYAYVCDMRDRNQAATSASHFLEAIKFFESHLKFTQFKVASVISPRVSGAAHAQFVTKRKLKQAPNRPLEAVKRLEEECIFGDSLVHAVVAGALLFCIFACARWSDISRIQKRRIIERESVVLIAETSQHKTSRSKEAQTRLLPYTAIGTFLEDQAWAKKFLESREKSGLAECDLLMPSYDDRFARWTNAPMSSAEATGFLREILEKHGGVQWVMAYSSHSRKATLLTWAGLVPLFSREERTQLGHHAEANTKSQLTYSRDSQILLQVKVAKLLGMIKDGSLDPDASRAERLRKLIEGETQQPFSEPVDISDTDESDIAEPEDNHPHQDARMILKDRPSIPVEVDEFIFVAHRFSGTIHVLQDISSGKLACGRKMSLNLQEVDCADSDAGTAPFCIQCDQVVKRNR